MKNEEDKELEAVRRAKLQKMKRSAASERQGAVLNKPVEVTDATLKETVQGHPLVVVDCWASWCGPCHMVAPVIEELARDYAGRILFGKLNVDENRGVGVEYEIVGIPTLLVFKNGELVDRIVGAMPRGMLESRITRYL